VSVFILRNVATPLWVRLTHAITRRGMNRQQAIEQAIDQWCQRVEATDKGGDTVVPGTSGGEISGV
jgi:hypothetical protein